MSCGVWDIQGIGNKPKEMSSQKQRRKETEINTFREYIHLFSGVHKDQ